MFEPVEMIHNDKHERCSYHTAEIGEETYMKETFLTSFVVQNNGDHRFGVWKSQIKKHPAADHKHADDGRLMPVDVH